MFGARHEKKAVAVGDSGGGGDVTSRNIGDSLGAPRDKQDTSVAWLLLGWRRLIKATRIWQRSRILQGATISDHVGCVCILERHPEWCLWHKKKAIGPRPLAFIFSRAPSANLT